MNTTSKRTITKRGISIVAAAAASMLALGGCASGGPDSEGLTEVIFAQPVPESVIQWPSYVADELGYFEEEGIKLRLAPAADISMAAFVTNGSALISAAGASEVLFAKREGADLSVVLDWWTRSAEGVMAMTSSGISSVADLEGQKVGVASDEDRAFLVAALGAEGLSEEDVSTVIVGGGGASVANALKEEKIMAFAGATSDFAALQAAGLELTDITPEALAATPASSFVVTPAALKDKRDLIVGFLRAYVKATHAGLADPEGLKAMSMVVVPDEWRDEAAGMALLEVVLRNAAPDDMNRIGDVRPAIWDKAQTQLIDVGELDGAQDLASILDDSLIAEINDWDRAEVEKEMSAWVKENGR